MAKMCRNFALIAVTDESKNYSKEMVRVRCKMWSCDYCAVVNARMWRYALTKQMTDRFLECQWSFFTVTVFLPDFHQISYEERQKKSALAIKENSNKLMMRLKYQFGKFTYIRVVESMKSGLLHLHFLASFWWTDLVIEIEGDKRVSRSETLSKMASGVGLGWVAHAENLVGENGEYLSPKRAVGYVTKYITKNSDYTRLLMSHLNIRKMQTSRDLYSPFNERFKHDSDTLWIIRVRIHKEEVIQSEKGIYDINRKKKIEIADFGDGIVYPPLDESEKED